MDEDLDLSEVLTTLQTQLKKVNQELLAPLLHEIAYSLIDLNRIDVEEVQVVPYIDADGKRIGLFLHLIWRNEQAKETIHIESIEQYAQHLQNRYKELLDVNSKFKDTPYLRKVAVEETVFKFRGEVPNEN